MAKNIEQTKKSHVLHGIGLTETKEEQPKS